MRRRARAAKAHRALDREEALLHRDRGPCQPLGVRDVADGHRDEVGVHHAAALEDDLLDSLRAPADLCEPRGDVDLDPVPLHPLLDQLSGPAVDDAL